MCRQKDLGLVVIDHLHILKSDKQFKDQYALLTYLSRRTKILAQDLNVPVLLLSQMNRANAARETKEPTMSDLRGSGSIEQDSNLVIFVYTAENLLRFQEPKEGTKNMTSGRRIWKGQREKRRFRLSRTAAGEPENLQSGLKKNGVYLLTAGEVLMTDFKTFGEACLALIKSWGDKDAD